MYKSKHKNTISDLSKRFFLAIERLGYSSSQIAKEVDGISQQTLTHIRTGRNAPSIKVITALLDKFPAINANWLLTGEGRVLLEDLPEREAVADAETEIPYFVEVLDGLTVEEIITYIHEYEENRNFHTNAVYKMFLKIRTQRKVIEELEAMEAKYRKELSTLRKKDD